MVTYATRADADADADAFLCALKSNGDKFNKNCCYSVAALSLDKGSDMPAPALATAPPPLPPSEPEANRA